MLHRSRQAKASGKGLLQFHSQADSWKLRLTDSRQCRCGLINTRQCTCSRCSSLRLGDEGGRKRQLLNTRHDVINGCSGAFSVRGCDKHTAIARQSICYILLRDGMRASRQRHAQNRRNLNKPNGNRSKREFRKTAGQRRAPHPLERITMQQRFPICEKPRHSSSHIHDGDVQTLRPIVSNRVAAQHVGKAY